MANTNTPQLSTSHYLDRLDDVRICVKCYHDYLEAEWSQSHSLTTQLTRRWVKPYGPLPYYLPFWVSDVFPEASVEQIHAVSTANVFLYHYYTLKDDALDIEGAVSTSELLKADAIFAEGLRILAGAGVTGEAFYSDLSRYIVEALKAECSLEQHKDQTIPYRDYDLRLMGQKAALVKVSASALATLADRRERLHDVELGLQAMAIGIQLLDDLKDWREDLQGGRYTYPLWLVSSREPVGHLDQPGMGRAIYTSAVCGDVLRKLNGHCYEARAHFQSLHADNMVSFLNSMIIESTQIIAKIDTGAEWQEIEKDIEIRLQGGT